MNTTTVPTFTSTNHAHAFGRAAGADELAALNFRIRQLRAEYRSTDRTIDEKFVIAFQLQFCREAIGAAHPAEVAA